MSENHLLSLYQNGKDEEQKALEELCRSFLEKVSKLSVVRDIVSQYPEAVSIILENVVPYTFQEEIVIELLAFARHAASVSEAKIK